MSTPTREPGLNWEDAVRAFRGDDWPLVVTREKLDAFLGATAHLDASAGDRLRQLAIALEMHSFRNGWADLRSIYVFAATIEPDNYRVPHSHGISASRWADNERLSDTERLALGQEAEAAYLAALRLAPGTSHIAHSLGILWYDHCWTAERNEEYRLRALGWFEQAVAWDVTNDVAHLYIAHCHHDVRDWPRAIAAYERVDLARLARNWPAWRAVKCREQLAACYAASGNLDEARRLLVAWLDEVSTLDDTALKDRVINVEELVDTLTRYLPDEGLIARTRVLIGRLNCAHWYPEFMA
jgi:tetratricopeptide (TPR) repeat protein